ncbi:MAG: calcium-binding protein [Acidimicrobiales bacterium]
MQRLNRLVVAVALCAAALLAIPLAASAGSATCGGHQATIVADGSGEPIQGTSGADVIVGTSGKDTIHGNGGDDIICGRGGADNIYGGGGNDLILGEKGHDKLRGGAGNDIIRAGEGNDRIWGKSGNDTARGAAGSDVCHAEDEASCELNKRWGHEPDHWLPLLAQYFGDIGETANARIVLGCESLGEPFIVNPKSGTTGLFQYREHIWDWINPLTPNWAGEVRQHPEASIATARTHYDWALENRDYGWDPWVNCGCHPDIVSPDKPTDCPYVP